MPGSAPNVPHAAVYDAYKDHKAAAEEVRACFARIGRLAYHRRTLDRDRATHASHSVSVDDLVSDEALPLGRGQSEQFAEDIVIVLAEQGGCAVD